MAEGPSSQKRMKVEVPQSSSPSSSHGFQSSVQMHHTLLLHAVEPASLVLFPSSNGPVTGEVDRKPSVRASEQVINSVDTSNSERDLHVSERNGILPETSTNPNIRDDLVIEQLTNICHPSYGPSVSERNVILQVNSVSGRGESVQTLSNSSHGTRDLDVSERNIVSQEISAPVSADPTVREDSVAEQTGVTLDYSYGARDLAVSEINGILQTTSASVIEEPVQASTGPLEAVSEAIISSSVQQVVINIEDIDYQEPANPGKSPRASREKDSMENADSMTCPICMESWTSEGSHRICCLACGHLFGRSCIRRWLKESGKKNSKCPHCNRKARIEDIRNLYVPSLIVVDQQLHEDLNVLRRRNEELVAQNDKLNKEFQHLQGLLASRDAQNETVRFFNRERHTYNAVRESGWNTIDLSMPGQRNKYSGYQSNRGALDKMGYKRQQTMEAALSHQKGYIRETDRSSSQQGHCFELQEEFSLLGARVFDMDALSQMILVAQKVSNGLFCLNKISLLSLSDKMIMPLPEGTGTVMDVRIAPPGGRLPGRLALVASLGKRLSLLSLESNNIVLTYTVQSPCWSCAWDPNEPNQVFAGCQDGSLIAFDLRQTSHPLRSIHGLSRQPVHTLQPINESNLSYTLRKNGILSASSSGVYFWEMTTSAVEDCRPRPITYVDNEGVCIALAYDHFANIAVSSFRPKPCITISNAIGSSGLSSQVSSQVNLGSHTRAAHVPLSRSANSTIETQEEEMSNANNEWKYGTPMLGHVSPIGMHRSAIVRRTRMNSSLTQNMFAFGDNETHSVLLWDVNTLNVVGNLRSHGSPILDIKSLNIDARSFLGCISVTTLQVYKG